MKHFIVDDQLPTSHYIMAGQHLNFTTASLASTYEAVYRADSPEWYTPPDGSTSLDNGGSCFVLLKPPVVGNNIVFVRGTRWWRTASGTYSETFYATSREGRYWTTKRDQTNDIFQKDCLRSGQYNVSYTNSGLAVGSAIGTTFADGVVVWVDGLSKFVYFSGYTNLGANSVPNYYCTSSDGLTWSAKQYGPTGSVVCGYGRDGSLIAIKNNSTTGSIWVSHNGGTSWGSEIKNLDVPTVRYGLFLKLGSSDYWVGSDSTQFISSVQLDGTNLTSNKHWNQSWNYMGTDVFPTTTTNAMRRDISPSGKMFGITAAQTLDRLYLFTLNNSTGAISYLRYFDYAPDSRSDDATSDYKARLGNSNIWHVSDTTWFVNAGMYRYISTDNGSTWTQYLIPNTTRNYSQAGSNIHDLDLYGGFAKPAIGIDAGIENES